ncbi:MAG TPA: FtsX-like permease family protein [Cyclobacteriaceae bacterium]|nr:FtsX-like permease family protein [Cyclobacteriaceae bacterium]
MSTFVLVWSYLKAKPLNTVLNILLLSMGIGVITTLILFNNQFQEKMSKNSRGIDLVVGAKGSPLQLVLCSVFHIDFPTGNIKLRDAEMLSKNRMVKRAIPMALGDSYRGFRIVGTDTSYTGLFGAKIKEGQWWSEDLEVVAGSSAAEVLKLKIGDTFASAHGLTSDGHDHDENLYKVTGILQPTYAVADNLLFTNISSVWKVHDIHEASDSAREITSLLIKYRNPIAALQLPRMINANTSMQAASPAFETARLFSILGIGVDVLLGIASTIIIVSALSIFIALYNSLKERRYDMAIMRSMGAGRPRLFTTVVMEGVALTFTGSVIGILLGHVLILGFTTLVEEGARTGISAFVFYTEEFILLGASLVLGVFCSAIPAWQAYRTDIHQVLSGN